MENIMEFEDNKPVSDEDRRLAEAKKLTLQPLHTDVIPESVSDSEIASRHLLEPAIGNAAVDTEGMSTLIMPTKSLDAIRTSAKPQARRLMAGIITGIVIFTSLAVFALLK
jgi:hypothetical protein